MHSHRIAFVPADIAQAVLDISPDGISAPIVKFACCKYILLACPASRAINLLSNWLQASFTARESGAYLEGTIRTRSNTPV